jgi:hypothetical protein
MIRKLLIAATLASAGLSSAALAHGPHGHGRVGDVQPRMSISVGSGYHDGFRVLFENGGQRYRTHTLHRPGPVIVLPPRHYWVHPRVARNDHGWKGGHGWDKRHDRHHDRRSDSRHHSRRS